MSRGHGKVEQAILDAVAKEHELIPPLEIARDNGYDITARSTRQSWHRAAHNLWNQDLTEERWTWPRGVSTNTSMLCVGAVGGTFDETTAAWRCGKLYAGRQAEKAAALTEAEFVLDMVERRRWQVVDKLTGKPVDPHVAWLDSQGVKCRRQRGNT